ncbi:eukaryotic translation initiation factor 4E1 isoform X2 [Drosophila busckii]|uniref:eukaryotic translation initiation factor 4E1 isoform X2 n=1 Tax=Drosophila busckii TaxID=30019 RepID=UPI00083ED128|nr:eukaryotic translation initiation factor 4E1 isoform X2 [Drosophila busckii]
MVVSENEKSSAVSASSEAVNANTVVPGRPEPAPNAAPIVPPPAANKEESKDSSEQSDEGAVRTEHLFKHPLQNTWTLWYLENDRTKSWEDMQNEITSFDTVEDFWSLYNHIKPPSEIKLGSDYSLFKKGIRPMWEDAANKQGGRWVITLNKSSKNDLDNLWLDVLLCLIGEAFDHSDQICGAVVNIRGKSNKISIWTANGNNEEAALEIGHKLRDALRLGRQNLLQYQLHKDTMVKQGSSVKSIYTL